MASFDDVTVEEEIADVSSTRPHVVLLGAGASKAALPNGDKYGRTVPLMWDLADTLGLVDLFPENLRDLAAANFEAAYSQLSQAGPEATAEIEKQIRDYFAGMELPDGPTLYDLLLLCLRPKDAIFTFNWDPFLIQALHRLNKIGIRNRTPRLFFLHGNVLVGYCQADECSGIIGRRCSTCGSYFKPGPLLFPVENKDYQDGSLIEREWKAVRQYLRDCFIFTVFGYSAPKTDVEAVSLLKDGWGDVADRQLEQVEIINRPGADASELRATWDSFIHTHHYEVFDSFYDSPLAKHPRRSCEAYFQMLFEARFVDENPVSRNPDSLKALVDWFKPLLDAEDASGAHLVTGSEEN